MAKYSDLRVRISEWAYMILLRATARELVIECDDADEVGVLGVGTRGGTVDVSYGS